MKEAMDLKRSTDHINISHDQNLLLKKYIEDNYFPFQKPSHQDE